MKADELTVSQGSSVRPKSDSRYAWYVLAALTVVNTYNTLDRFSLSILAEDVKKSFALSDSDLGFLTGTAFAIFYALFGYPLARLADRWCRVRLLAIGLAVWSTMTTLSGFATSLVEMSVFRLGLGMGEATVSPVGYSLLSDWFSKSKRGTALGFFGSGIYIGMGLSLFLGGLIVSQWNRFFPSVKPFGLEGWQVTFFAFGVPGLLLALWVATLREPLRGQADGVQRPVEGEVWSKLFQDFSALLPPLTFFEAAKRGRGALLANIAMALVSAGAAWVLYRLTGDWMQWSALAFGYYAAFSASSSLKGGDRPTFALTWGTPAFVLAMIGFGAATTINTVLIVWTAPLAVRTFSMGAGSVGLVLGVITAVGGAIGAIVGGRISDLLLKRTPLARIWVGIAATVIPLPFTIAMCLTHDPTTFFLCYLPVAVIGKAWIAPGAATIQDLVLPRMRGTATNIYFLVATLVGSGLAPYVVGKISVLTHSLANGMWWTLTVIIALAAGSLLLCARTVVAAEESKWRRATTAGEPN